MENHIDKNSGFLCALWFRRPLAILIMEFQLVGFVFVIIYDFTLQLLLRHIKVNRGWVLGTCSVYV